jgi:hypothetical protein
MSMRDIIVGTVVTAVLVVVVVWVAISIYHHEFEGEYGQAAQSASYAAAQIESIGLS